MPSIPLHLVPESPNPQTPNPLPPVLQTPAGLAILEIQGAINLSAADASMPTTPIGRLVFPDYDFSSPTSDTAWMKKVHLYVGQHQRLTGEVKKLSNPIAVLRKRDRPSAEVQSEQLEIAEVIHYKLLFSNRPEPVGA